MTSGYLDLIRRNGDFRRLFGAQLISYGGDWFLTIPLLGLIYEMTGSGVAVAAVFVAEAMPMFLFSPLAGMVADRFDRKRIMIVADIGRAAAAACLLLVDDLSSPALAFALLALVAVGSSFFFPASNGALPNLVAPADLGAASVLMGSAWATMAAIGAAAGGLVAATVSRDAAFILNALSFLASAWLIHRVRARFRIAPTGAKPFGAAILEAVRFARAQPRVLALLASKSGFALAAGAIALLPVLALEAYESGDGGTGLLYAMRGLGAMIGPLLARRLLGHRDRLLIGSIGYTVAAWGFGYLALSVAPGLWWAALVIGLAHVGGGVEWAISTYGLQRMVPDEMRGRIFALDYAAVTLAMSIAFLAAGALEAALGVRAVVALSGALGIGWGIGWSVATRRLWTGLD